jgi:protein-tyrosine-phosphatase
MLVHFICRGNTFRSRLAEAYLNSLKLSKIKAISSGTVAKLHSESNKNNFNITQDVLTEHGIEKYNKDSWDQLTTERLRQGDVVIFLNVGVKEECEELFGLPDEYIVWGIKDFDEVSPIPRTKDEIYKYTNNTYDLVKNAVDNLINNLGK